MELTHILDSVGTSLTKFFLKLGLLAGVLVLLIVLIDYIDLLYRSVPYMKLAPAYPHSYLTGRFRTRKASDNMDEILQNAYFKYTKKGRVFARKTELNNWSLMFPSKISHEWRNLPLDQVSFQNWVHEGGLLKHHTVLTKAHSKVPLLFSKREMLLAIQKTLVTETRNLLPEIISDAKDWTSFDIMQVCSDLVIKLNATILYGPTYSEDEDFLKRSIDFANGVDGINSVYFNWPRLLWRLAFQIHPTIREFYSNVSHLKKKLLPDVRSRVSNLRAQAEQGTGRNSVRNDDDLTLMTSLIRVHIEDETLGEKEGDLEQLCMEAIFYTYEFWGPLMPTLFFMLMEISRSEHYLASLREEISSALGCDGWCSDFLMRTPKLESFIREVLRLHVPAQSTVSRRTAKPIYIQSLDMTIPAGVNLGVPAKYIHHDPDFYLNPTTFDGLRFYDPKTNDTPVRATTASDTYLAFSHGSGLCPGRAFGVHIVQVLCAIFIMEYDIKLDSDDKQSFPRVTSTKEGRGDALVGRTDALVRKRVQSSH